MELEKILGPSHRFETSKSETFDFSGLRGRVVEFSGWGQSACLSLTLPFLAECQSKGMSCAWIVPRSVRRPTLFFPPDFQDAGVDLSSLPILWADTPVDACSLAEKLLRSNGFGMIVLDLHGCRFLKNGIIGRLHSLAQKQRSLVLCLTQRPAGQESLDPMVFLHVHVSAWLSQREAFLVKSVVQKDKIRSPGRVMERRYEAPDGLC